MKISAISKNNLAFPNFNGEWKERRVGHFFANRYHTECTYYPNEGESMHDIARAWQYKTGELPSEWVRRTNMYNQKGEKTYHLADSYYMPLNLIKASLEIERKQDKQYGQEEKAVAELARISKQAGDVNSEKEYEAELRKIADKKLGAKNRTLMKEFLNNYKDGMGEELFGYNY